MDEHIQSFLELTAKDDLVQLVADKRAAWLWSSDGARILWANAAGAAFFSASTVRDLAGLTSLERSPARPHIARIAETGLTDRFSIDRLRFYRGLRVMLLTCQCKRVELDNGETAALIICGDNGIATTRDPVSAFGQLLISDTATVFILSEGKVSSKTGRLDGVPEDLELPQGQPVLSGALDLEGSYHEGIVVQIPAGPKVVVLTNEPMTDDQQEPEAETDPGPEPVTSGDTFTAFPASAAGAARQVDEEEGSVEDTPPSDADHREDIDDANAIAGAAPAPETDRDETDRAETDWVRADEVYLEEDLGDQAVIPVLSDIQPSEGPAAPVAEEALATMLGEEAAEETTGEPAEEAEPATGADNSADAPAERETSTSGGDSDVGHSEGADDGDSGAFVFKPRRRPVRFAWKMDIDQRFTFLSDEFSDVLGPEATAIVGSTWQDVSEKFGLDPRGQIARALDRRDTWSGKTVEWPVTGAALRVPVDMAALPAFDRNRKFEGYRGFGVCRTADAVQDPDGPVGSVSAAIPADASPEIGEEFTEAPSTDASGAADDSGAVPSAENQTVEGEVSEVTADAAAGTGEETSAGKDEPGAKMPQAVSETDEGETVPAAASTPQARVEDLKPLQPDSFKGKTFLGASAAALVGSLAKFTGKPPSAESAASGEDLTEELRAAAAALNEASEEAAEKDARAADHTEADDIETAGSEASDDAADTQEHMGEDAAEDANTPAGPTGETDLSSEAEIPFSSDDPAPSGARDETSADGDGDETAKPAIASEEPSGISGPAPLKPDEIESAVKTLAKSYRKPVKATPDLFEESEAANIGPRDVPSSEAAGTPDETEEAAQDGDSHKESGFASDSLIEDDLDMDASGAPDEALSGPDAPAKDAHEADPDEKEFFEETAAYHLEDRAAARDGETSPEADSEPVREPERTGKVIPLATARPRVVPVDTSGLSRPEREAFRKIAEALGARLEGDLDDFNAPDQNEPEPEEAASDLPAPDPIDPSLLDRLPIGIAIVHDREVLYSNKALLKMLGYRSTGALSEAGGLEALFIDDTEDLPDAARMDGEVDEPMKMRHADGGVVCVDAHMHAVPWNGSRGLMISVTERPVRPATAADPAEQASPNFFAEVRSELESARNQIAEMDTILETATDGVLVLDEHGSIVKVNGSAEALFSASRSDMIGAPFTEFLAPESHRAAADYLDGLSRNGVASILNDGREVLGKVPTGGLIPLFMTMGRITSAKDDARYCAVLRDITQWKTAEEELTQAKRQAENASSQKSDFLAKISHEIRTPLNAIIGFSEVMMEERFGPIGNERYKDYLKDIRTSGSHIMSLINDLLDLSKIEAGKLDLKFTAVSTNDVINECVALMQPQANRERVIIRASLPESVPDVVADPRSLRQIVLNLLSNAIKYNRSGGQVILSTALENNGEVVLRVRDTGTGMTAKQLAAALEPFRQLHTSSRGGGTGLGLPLTKALVEANRASFHIDSTPDQGTLVEIVFPTQRVLSE